MGQGADKMARVVMHTKEQLLLKGMLVKEDVGELVKGWFEDGAPLGLDLEGFEAATRLQRNSSEKLFEVFDTDQNQKVDALEVLSALVVLATGSLEDKMEVLLPIFDFSGSGHMNFDETNIFLHSVCRGLQKVCGMEEVEDQAVVELCRLMFDSHNVPYQKHITKDQMRRWLKNDVDVAKYLECFHGAISLPDAAKDLERLSQEQAKIFTEVSGHASVPVALDGLLSRNDFLESVGRPPEAIARAVLAAAAGGPHCQSIPGSRFSDGLRAWNIFRMVDSEITCAVEAVELKTLLWLQLGTEPSDQVMDKRRIAMSLAEDQKIPVTAWVAASVEERPVALGAEH